MAFLVPMKVNPLLLFMDGNVSAIETAVQAKLYAP